MLGHEQFKGNIECADFQGCGLQAKVPADDRPVLLRASHFGQDGMLRLVGSRLAEHAATPLASFFWAAGFSFSRSQLLQEVIAPRGSGCNASNDCQYAPDKSFPRVICENTCVLEQVPYEDLPFLFFGEEQYMLARMFTYGYDVFTPPRSVAYHRYSRAYRETFQAAAPQVAFPANFDFPDG